MSAALTNAIEPTSVDQEDIGSMADAFTLAVFQQLNKVLNKRGLMLTIDVLPKGDDK